MATIQFGIDWDSARNDEPLAEGQEALLGDLLYSVLAPKFGGEHFRKYPHKVRGTEEAFHLYRLLNSGTAQERDFYFDKLCKAYVLQENARYACLLKDLLGDEIDIGLIGDIAEYIKRFNWAHFGPDEKCDEESRDDLLTLYKLAQVPFAHRFLFPSSLTGANYLEFGEHIDVVRGQDMEVLRQRGYDFDSFGDALLRLFRGEDQSMLRDGVSIELSSMNLSRIACPFPHCTFEVYSNEGHPEEYFKLTDADGNTLDGECMLWHSTKAHQLVRCKGVRGERVTASSLLRFFK